MMLDPSVTRMREHVALSAKNEKIAVLKEENRENQAMLNLLLNSIEVKDEKLAELQRALRSVRKNIPEGCDTAFRIIDAALCAGIGELEDESRCRCRRASSSRAKAEQER